MTIAKAIRLTREYLDDADATVDLVPDPNNPTYYAANVNGIHFIVDVAEDDPCLAITEVEFTAWPPRIR